MVIHSPTLPPGAMYDILISVDTPVDHSPCEAAANDLATLERTRRGEPSQINHCGYCSAVKGFETVCMVLLDLHLCYDFARD
jgi:hypothetical protein